MTMEDPDKQRFIVVALIITLAILAIVFTPKAEGEDTHYSSIDGFFLSGVDTPYIFYEDMFSAEIRRVIHCESGTRQHDSEGNLIIGQAGEIGIAQFMKGTWDMFNEERGTNLDITKKNDQLDLMAWAFENNYQNHWTCY